MSVTENEALRALQQENWLRRLDWSDWIWAALVVSAVVYTLTGYSGVMDVYETWILVGSGISLIALGWFWKSMRWASLVVAGLSIMAVMIYAAKLPGLPSQFTGRAAVDVLSSSAAADKPYATFFLKYFLASKVATMWMCAMFVVSTLMYFLAILLPAGTGASKMSGKWATGLTWAGTIMALVALMVRWRESYLISPDAGHIPVSNLYEVFILFIAITALIYLYYEQQVRTKALGGFVSLIILAAVGFLFWYHTQKDAHEIKALLPALQSWWMKIHVPANFVGYGAFAVAAMVGVLHLLNHYSANKSIAARIAGPGLTLLFALFFGLYKAAITTRVDGKKVFQGFDWASPAIWVSLGVGLVLILLGWLTMKSRIQKVMPPNQVLEDVQYKAIGLGFVFFTIATILGAAWADDAWGAAWSWDPKETWALIVWLNYAGWLHMRFLGGLRGAPMSWWSVVGLFVTTFAFLGVNMFLSGLHSYGEL